MQCKVDVIDYVRSVGCFVRRQTFGTRVVEYRGARVTMVVDSVSSILRDAMHNDKPQAKSIMYIALRRLAPSLGCITWSSWLRRSHWLGGGRVLRVEAELTVNNRRIGEFTFCKQTPPT